MIAHVLVKIKPEVPDRRKQAYEEELAQFSKGKIKLVSHGKFFIIDLGSYNEGQTRSLVKEMSVTLLANQTIEQSAIYDVKITSEDRERLISDVRKIAQEHELEADYLGEIKSVGVMGDDRSYTPVIVLSGKFPGWDVLQQVSNKISNETLVNRVTFDFTPPK